MIPYGKHYLDSSDLQAVVNVLKNGNLTQGEHIEEFERSISDYVGVNYAVAVSSGTAALHLAVMASGLGWGESLITSPITFVASANAGLYVGGRIGFADIDPETLNLSLESLSKVLIANTNTKVVIPVHFAGLPCDMQSISYLARNTNAIVIEDAAHALGASYPDGRRVGCCSHSLMTIFSFHPVKSIAAGEGGMITTNDEKIYRRLIRLRSHGINKLDDPLVFKNNAYTNGLKNPWYYEVQELGFHYRITDIQCALGNSQLKKLNKFIARRRELVLRYDAAFSGKKNFRPAQRIGRDISAHHIYPLCINYDKIGATRAQVMTALKLRGIGTQVHYIPLPMQPLYHDLDFDRSTLQNAFSYYDQALTIPLYYGLTNEQQDYIIRMLFEVLE